MINKFKKLVILFLVFFIPLTIFAQKDVTQFLGIPIDGFKPEMIQKLKNKGFTVNPRKKDVLEGEFNGSSVNLYVVTNNNKVCRIMVADANPKNESDIKIRFNTLCQQFYNNKKYMSSSKTTFTIPEDEKISYKMTFDNKRYQASFYQLPLKNDSISIINEMKSFLLSKYTKEQLENKSEEFKNEISEATLSHMVDLYSKKSVWFMIKEEYGNYYISLFYDNEYNMANGEGL